MKILAEIDIEIHDMKHCSLLCEFCDYAEGCRESSVSCGLFLTKSQRGDYWDETDLDLEMVETPLGSNVKMELPIRCKKCRKSYMVPDLDEVVNIPSVQIGDPYGYAEGWTISTGETGPYAVIDLYDLVDKGGEND